MVLGYIVIDKRLKGVDGFVKQVDDISKADLTKPTLIVGWEKAKAMPQYRSILDMQLDENLFWTFGKTESRQDLEVDLQKFYKVAYDRILDSIRYYYANVVTIKYTKAKKLLEYLYSPADKYIYLNGGMAYVDYPKGSIIGISLNVLGYCGVNAAKAVAKVRSNPHNHVVKSDDRRVYKIEKALGNKRYAVPYFIKE